MGLYDEVEIEDMEWSDELEAFTYSCPCGDLFQITLKDLAAGEDIARCPSCSLYVQVIYDQEDVLKKYGRASGMEETRPAPIAVA